MAIDIHHMYSTHVSITFYSKDSLALRYSDCGEMDYIAEQVSEILVKHNFSEATVHSATTDELLMIIERT